MSSGMVSSSMVHAGVVEGLDGGATLDRDEVGRPPTPWYTSPKATEPGVTGRALLPMQ
jgi:hypothetical protein